MTNKYIASPPTDVILARLKVLLESTNELYSSGRMVLESDLISSFHSALNLFYESLDGSILKTTLKLYPGTPADPTTYNQFTSAVQKDLRAVFSELSAVDRLVCSSFNSIIAEREQALQLNKETANKLGDYLLYADPKLGAGFFFGDSFSSSERIETGSSLVDKDECYVNTEEGIVLLPLDGSPDVPSVKSITINQNSNGEAGSNYQLDVFGHSDLEVLSDSEPNTWFEYEKVTVYELTTPLILDLTIALDELAVINHININPINFGTASPVKIRTIETSKDGVEFVSIKDEVPIKDFVPVDDEDEFSLCAATSKFSGQGFYSFLPRKVQYVHLVFEQHTPYTIETNNGSRLRYAIGIRDINILGRKFLTEGSLVSIPFAATEEIKKVSLWAAENPTEASALADLSHFVSADDGGSWVAIQPQNRVGTEALEVVNFNNIAEGAISTEQEVKTLRHKITMKRDKDAFKGDVTIKQERIKQMDVVSLPGAGKFDIVLNEKPIKKSTNVMFPFLGSFSCPRPRFGASVRGESVPMDLDFVEFSVDAPGERIFVVDEVVIKEGTLRYKLPFKNIVNLEEHLRVFVNGEQIEYSPKAKFASDETPTSYSSTGIDENSKVYFLNKKGIELQFGYSDSDGTQRGYIPPGGSKVQVCLDGDNPFLRLTERGYVLNLTTHSDGQKESVSLLALTDQVISGHEIEIPTGADTFKSEPDMSAVKLNQLTKSEEDALRANLKLAPQATKTQMVSLGATSPSGFSSQVQGLGTTNKLSPLLKSFSSANKKTLDYIAQTAGETGSILPELDHKNQDIFTYGGIASTELYEGMFPPVFVEGVDNFDIVEYDLDGEVITNKQFTNKVPFVDGDSELRDSHWEKEAASYTFDAITGTVYLGSAPPIDRKVVLTCKKRNLKLISQDFWQFDYNQVTGKINTQKILLDPRVVITMKRTKSFTFTDDKTRQIVLLSASTLSHDWTKERLVRGTVRPEESLFGSGVKPTEVKFINGSLEFANIIEIIDEPITFTSAGTSLYTFQLSRISSTKLLNGNLSFAPVRQINSVTIPDCEFALTPQVSSATLNTDGQWKVDTNGLVTFYLSTTPKEHVVTYKVKNLDSGLDINGLYSVDYDNAVIHFGTEINDSGNVAFEVSAYSAFYNLAEEVSVGDIDKIDEEKKTITFGPAFGLRLLKQATASKSRPQVLKVFYDTYRRSTESLADLEPYFSPICKDIAFRAVTGNLLGEL